MRAERGQVVKSSGRVAGAAQVIHENLRRAYDEGLEDGIPDRFQRLLEELRAREGEK